MSNSEASFALGYYIFENTIIFFFQIKNDSA